MARGQKQFLAVKYRRVEGVLVGAEADGLLFEVDRPVAAKNRKTLLEKFRVTEQRNAVLLPVQLDDVVVLARMDLSNVACGVNRVARLRLQCVQQAYVEINVPGDGFAERRHEANSQEITWPNAVGLENDLFRTKATVVMFTVPASCARRKEQTHVSIASRENRINPSCRNAGT